MRCNTSMFSQVVQYLDLDFYASSIKEYGSTNKFKKRQVQKENRVILNAPQLKRNRTVI